MRRDLRLYDHAALSLALGLAGNVQPVFVFDRAILSRFTNPADRRLRFLAHTLCELHQALRKMGGGLLVIDGTAERDIPALATSLGASDIVCAEDFEPATRVRDAAVAAAVKGQIGFHCVVDHLTFHAGHVVKPDGTPYRVFTPYSKAWRAALKADSFSEKEVNLQGQLADVAAFKNKAQQAGLRCLDVDAGPGALLAAIGYQDSGPDEWSVNDATKRLHHFIEQRVFGYKEGRDAVWDEGTSKISPYLRFGLVSVRHCARLAMERPGQGSDTWVDELIWREFYAMILYHYPEVVDLEFQSQTRGLPWHKNAVWLDAWKAGKTGYPIVDAAMRQLAQTGWMHNRARMIVASFFTKDLHLNWREGEEHFAQLLMDYDLSSNNGGWQWAASTGTDAQPYFRIFNPELQSKRFDPAAAYIKRYVPELRDLDADAIHALHRGPSLLKPTNYPAPLVDHFEAKARAIAMFKPAPL